MRYDNFKDGGDNVVLQRELAMTPRQRPAEVGHM